MRSATQRLFAGLLLAAIGAPAFAAQVISQFQPDCYTIGYDAFASCTFTPGYADGYFTTYSSVRQDVGFFASASSHDVPQPGYYVTSDLNGGQTVNFGAIGFSAAMTGVSGYGGTKATVSGLGQYFEHAVVSSKTLPLGTPVDFYITHRLNHFAESTFNGQEGSIVTYFSNATSIAAVTVLGNQSNGEKSFYSQMSVNPLDLVNSRGGQPIETTGLVHVLIGETIEIFQNFTFAMGAEWPGGMDSLGAENNFFRLTANTAQIRVSPLFSGKTNSMFSASASDSFYLATESGFDYSSPFAVVAVPEPTCFTLFVLGMAVLFTVCIRRRQVIPKWDLAGALGQI